MRRFARRSCAVIWRSGSYPSVVPAAWTEPAPPKAMTTRSAKALAFLRKTGRATRRRGFVIRSRFPRARGVRATLVLVVLSADRPAPDRQKQLLFHDLRDGEPGRADKLKPR